MDSYEWGTLHKVECAADVKPKDLFVYLCEDGPFLCLECPVPCAYGQRWLAERQEQDAERARKKWEFQQRKRAREARKNAVPKMPGGQNRSEGQPG